MFNKTMDGPTWCAVHQQEKTGFMDLFCVLCAHAPAVEAAANPTAFLKQLEASVVLWSHSPVGFDPDVYIQPGLNGSLVYDNGNGEYAVRVRYGRYPKLGGYATFYDMGRKLGELEHHVRVCLDTLVGDLKKGVQP